MYLQSLIERVDRKNCWQLAETAGEENLETAPALCTGHMGQSVCLEVGLELEASLAISGSDTC